MDNNTVLELKGITKTYETAGESVQALKGIDLQFGSSEFVSILGPSGCGKTTMLNIIGGLDRYTSGDLVINGVSTKNYKNRDWDTYRNHSIGFVFQNYYLIPHQSVITNVELSMTLAGVSKKERRERAKEALRMVGLESQMRKRPNQLSGGQMQRVAIARAIVNNPDIILADEPTGALDTQTSIQVMDILKELSKDRLVIMVTHNPDLADRYSTRIVRMLDGLITDDSQIPQTEQITEDTEKASPEKQSNTNTEQISENGMKKKGKKQKVRKPSMSFGTAFGLSLKNLFTKKGRTILTCFAGSIGIIGIALIYAVSQGTTMYIDAVQEETLSSYPLTIQAQTVDTSNILSTFMGKAKELEGHEKDAVYQKDIIYEMINSLTTVTTHENDLQAFKTYIETEWANEESPLHDALNGIQYSYNNDLVVYTKAVDGKITKSDTQALLSQLMSSMSRGGSSSSSSVASMMAGNTWTELLQGEAGEPINELVTNQYDIIYGRWPSSYDEIVLFVDENNELDDMTLYALGLKTEDEVKKLMMSAMMKREVEYESRSWSYEEICSRDFRTILTCDCYALDPETKLYVDTRGTDESLAKLYDNALVLRVVGIARPNEDASSHMVNGTAGYTHGLTEYIIAKAKESQVVKAQLASPDKNIVSGKEFSDQQSDLTKALRKLGYVDLNKPSSISLFASSFAAKDIIEDAIAQYNKGLDKLERIKYTDYVGIIMSSVTTIINAITYVLIAFVSVSLIVSSIMIGVITLISVQERTKEIGILRAIGASKRNVSTMFNAETGIIGFVSGLFGVGLTWLLTIPINAILHAVTGIGTLGAYLPPRVAMILVLISTLLTLIAGIIPSRSAAKKDPVVALRTE